jgi:hypothetical protein
MDAPSYPPAAAFVQPATVPYQIGLRSVPIGSLMQMPAAWAIVLKHLPSFQFATGSSMIKPHLGNMTVVDLAQFIKPLTPDELAQIDAELRSLPAADQVVP